MATDRHRVSNDCGVPPGVGFGLMSRGIVCGYQLGRSQKRYSGRCLGIRVAGLKGEEIHGSWRGRRVLASVIVIEYGGAQWSSEIKKVSAAGRLKLINLMNMYKLVKISGIISVNKNCIISIR